MNYPYLSLTRMPDTYQSPYQQQPAPFPPTMVTANAYVALTQTSGTSQAQQLDILASLAFKNSFSFAWA